MSEKLLEQLETRVAFQDQELQDMSDVLIKQQQRIDILEARIKLLEDKLKDIRPSMLVPESEETPPPHY